MESKAYFFPSPLRQPHTIVIAENEMQAKVEYRRISGKVADPLKVRQVIFAGEADDNEIAEVELAGNTPARKYQVFDELEFPILSYYGGELPDVNDDDPAQWDMRAVLVNEAFPWLNLTDGSELRDRLIDEMNRWEKKYQL